MSDANPISKLPEELITDLLAIAGKDRRALTNADQMVYNEVYRITNNRTPGRGCSGICDSVWLVGRNVIKKLALVRNTPAPADTKAKVEMKRVGKEKDLSEMTAKELKQIATERNIPFAKNATKATMLKLLTN